MLEAAWRTRTTLPYGFIARQLVEPVWPTWPAFLLFSYEYTAAFFRHTLEECIGSHYRWLRATMWLLRIELRISGKGISALND